MLVRVGFKMAMGEGDSGLLLGPGRSGAAYGLGLGLGCSGAAGLMAHLSCSKPIFSACTIIYE